MLQQEQQFFRRLLLLLFLATFSVVVCVFTVLQYAQVSVLLTCITGAMVVGTGYFLAHLTLRTVQQRIQENIRASVDKIVNFVDTLSASNGALSPSLESDKNDLPSLQRAHEAVRKLAAKPHQDLQEMKRLERMRSEFLGNVSHELRTPIFAIQGFLETLLDGALEDESVRRNFVERAYSNTLRLNALLTDLINISRIESGEMRLSFRYFPLLPFVEEVVANMSVAHEHLNLNLRVESRIDAALEVFGDRDRLAQVLTNLLDNGMKYNVPHGSVTVILETIRDGKGVEEVRVSVRDTGIGIAQEHHRRVFERFYRVDKARSRSVGGTGLGLAIVKHILEAHKSAIYIESKAGSGTTMSFTLKRGE